MSSLQLYGGFGEKGRTCLGLELDGLHVLFDAGIKVGAEGDDYHPAIPAALIRRLDAVFISHAHEDHVGALSWLLAHGFSGQLFLSRASWAEAPEMQRLYARPEDLPHFRVPEDRLVLFEPGETLSCGPLHLRTGRSGHVPGGCWYLAQTPEGRIGYCGDVVPHSPVLVMDPLPRCDVLILDASYGADDYGGPERVAEIRRWLSSARQGCLLPLPVAGKPLEMLALLDGPLAIHQSMFAPIRAQLAQSGALRPSAAAGIAQTLERAQPWHDGEPLPPCPLLVWDGMGQAGPAVDALARARAAAYPILLTGHLPAGTPARELAESGAADWIRVATHPIASENRQIWRQSGASRVLGHSADAAALAQLQRLIPPLDLDARTGGEVVLAPQHAHSAR